MAATPAVTALERAKVAHTLHAYDHDPRTTAWGDEAVAALGVDPARVLKTLVVTAGDHLALAVLAVSASLDLKALGASLGTKRVTLAAPTLAEATTGGVVGAISPVAPRKRLVTVVDADAARHATVFCSAGRRGLELELAPADLVAVTSAQVAPIARFPDPA